MDKKGLIVKHAVDVIAEKGYSGATPKLIASRAGIAVGTIYLYFKSKEEILDYIFLQEFIKREKFLNGINKIEYSIFEKIERFLDFHFAQLKDDANTGTVLIQESTHPQQQELEGVQSFTHELPRVFAKMLLVAQKKDEIRALDCEVISNIFFHSIRGAVISLKMKETEGNYLRIKDELKTFLWNGIKK